MRTQKQYIKKVIVEHPRSSSLARAERLRRIRHMANLNRQEMCNSEGLNINTYKGWEISRYGGLPADGAAKAIARVAKHGVVCDLEWLLHGVGLTPYILPELEGHPAKNISKFDPDREKQHILDEIEIVKKQHAAIISHQIEDNALSHYGAGDLVAGVPYFQPKITNAIEKDCIIQMTTGLIVARRLQHGETAGKYDLVCTNPQASKEPAFHNVDIVSAAPIIRHYRRSSW